MCAHTSRVRSVCVCVCAITLTRERELKLSSQRCFRLGWRVFFRMILRYECVGGVDGHQTVCRMCVDAVVAMRSISAHGGVLRRLDLAPVRCAPRFDMNALRTLVGHKERARVC